MKKLLMICVAGTAVWLSPAAQSQGAFVFSTRARAVQDVNLFGISATLKAFGSVDWTLDLDSNGNSSPGTSTIDSLFFGILPKEFAPIGAAGLPFELYSLDSEIVTVTGNGTHVSVDTTFGLTVYLPGHIPIVEFYTSDLSDFSADTTSIPFKTPLVFQDPNRPADSTNVYIGANIFGIPADTLVGVSFNRTVSTPVPEPGTLTLAALGLVSLGGVAWRRRREPR